MSTIGACGRSVNNTAADPMKEGEDMAYIYRYLVNAGEHQGKACRPLRASATKPGWVVVYLKDEGTTEVPLIWIESKMRRHKAKSKRVRAGS